MFASIVIAIVLAVYGAASVYQFLTVEESFCQFLKVLWVIISFWLGVMLMTTILGPNPKNYTVG